MAVLERGVRGVFRRTGADISINRVCTPQAFHAVFHQSHLVPVPGGRPDDRNHFGCTRVLYLPGTGDEENQEE